MNRTHGQTSTLRTFGSRIGLPKGQAGFTLIEVMITVVIVAVLVAFAYPVYTQHVVKTRRAAAVGCLLEQAQYMERFHTTHMQYHQERSPPNNPVNPPACSAEVAKFYTVGLTGTTTAAAYSLQAVPTSVQNDPKCGTLTITQSGAKTVSGTWSSTPAECW